MTAPAHRLAFDDPMLPLARPLRMRRAAFLCAGWLALTIVPAAAIACSGDCNGDREVTVDEIVSLVSIALGTRDAATCVAGDTSGDGEITVDELQAAINAALDGCPTDTFEPSIDLGSASTAAGGQVTIAATLVRSEGLVAATSNDIFYDRTLVQVGRIGARPNCTIDPRLGEGTIPDKMLLLSVLPREGNLDLLRVGVIGFNQELISDGALFQCVFTVPAGTPTQTVLLTNVPGASDVLGNQIENRSCDGPSDPLPCCTGPGNGTCTVGGTDGEIFVE